MIKLIALLVIAAGAFAANSPALQVGDAFEATPDAAEELLTSGQARLADTPLSEASKPQTPKAPKSTKARLLSDGAHGKVNDVVDLDSAQLKELEAAGLADSTKAAVAYALTLPQNNPTAAAASGWL